MATAAQQVEGFQHGRVPRPVRERQLLELAEALFAERGYAGASMDELARRAGVTKPVVYELFGSKDGLFERLRRPLDRSAWRPRSRPPCGPRATPRRACAPAGWRSSASPPATAWPGT